MSAERTLGSSTLYAAVAQLTYGERVSSHRIHRSTTQRPMQPRQSDHQHPSFPVLCDCYSTMVRKNRQIPSASLALEDPRPLARPTPLRPLSQPRPQSIRRRRAHLEEHKRQLLRHLRTTDRTSVKPRSPSPRALLRPLKRAQSRGLEPTMTRLPSL